MIIVWPSAANAGIGASAAAAASRAIANPLKNLMVSPLLGTGVVGLLALADHLESGARLAGAVRIALVLQHVVLGLDLVRRARAAAGQDVHDVRVAVGVGAAAEAVLALILADLAGQHVGLVREPLVGLHHHLVAPLRGIAAAELVEVDRRRDRPAGALDPGRDDERRLG